MDYLLLKMVHQSLAILTLISFFIRGCWMLVGSKFLNHSVSKVAPHLIDTTLLLSALGLVVVSGLNPFSISWISAKLILLVAYILLGSVALKRGKSKQVKSLAFVAALACIAGIFWFAVNKPYF